MSQFAWLLILSITSLAPESFAPLFIVERTTNANVVHYDAKIDEYGEITSKEPIVAYWTIGSADGKRQNLSFLERKLAWGFNVRKKLDGRYSFSLVSQKQIEINVYRKDGIVRAEASISGRRAYLRKIFVNIEGPILVPKVNYFDLFGTDVQTGEERYERIIPAK